MKAIFLVIEVGDTCLKFLNLTDKIRTDCKIIHSQIATDINTYMIIIRDFTLKFHITLSHTDILDASIGLPQRNLKKSFF